MSAVRPLELSGSGDARQFQGMIGAHPTMLKLFDEIGRAARLQAPILIYGPTGSGKELVARAVHTLSTRSGCFVPVNVAAIPEQLSESELFGCVKGAYTGATADRPGLIEAAGGGTLYLDEAGELPQHLQAKLLRTLEDGTVRPMGGVADRIVRFGLVVSLQQPPHELVNAGRWRSDFLYRVAGVVLRVPPLRERPSDIALLVDHWLRESGGRSLSATSASLLSRYHWPGNVRELRRAVERAAFLVGVEKVTAGDILEATEVLGMPAPEARPGDDQLALDDQLTLKDLERRHIEVVLRQTGFNARAAAGRLGLSIRQFYRRLQALDLPPPRRRRPTRSLPN